MREMTWIRAVIALVLVGGGLWVFSPGSHKPTEVRQMQVGFLDEEFKDQLNWVEPINDTDEDNKEMIDQVVAIFEESPVVKEVQEFNRTADIEVILLNLNKNQYIIDGGVFFTDEGAIYQSRDQLTTKLLSNEEIEILQQLQE